MDVISDQGSVLLYAGSSSSSSLQVLTCTCVLVCCLLFFHCRNCSSRMSLPAVVAVRAAVADVGCVSLLHLSAAVAADAAADAAAVVAAAAAAVFVAPLLVNCRKLLRLINWRSDAAGRNT